MEFISVGVLNKGVTKYAHVEKYLRHTESDKRTDVSTGVKH